MAVAMARLLRDGERVFHGVASPLPMVAILLAQRLHAPNLVYINITGGINARPESLPQTTVDPRLTHGSHSIFKLADLFDSRRAATWIRLFSAGYRSTPRAAST